MEGFIRFCENNNATMIQLIRSFIDDNFETTVALALCDWLEENGWEKYGQWVRSVLNGTAQKFPHWRVKPTPPDIRRASDEWHAHQEGSKWLVHNTTGTKFYNKQLYVRANGEWRFYSSHDSWSFSLVDEPKTQNTANGIFFITLDDMMKIDHVHNGIYLGLWDAWLLRRLVNPIS